MLGGGSNLPPGVTTDMIDPGDDPCEVCFQHPDECICAECPQCGNRGKIECYHSHGLNLSKQQALYREQQKIEDLKDDIAEAERYIEYLHDQSDDFTTSLRY